MKCNIFAKTLKMKISDIGYDLNYLTFYIVLNIKINLVDKSFNEKLYENLQNIFEIKVCLDVNFTENL